MPAELKRIVPITHSVTAEEVAKLFCSLDSEEQAAFFNTVAEEADSWDRQFCFQMQSVIDSYKLNAGGIAIMKQIGEYGESALEAARHTCCEGKKEDKDEGR